MMIFILMAPGGGWREDPGFANKAPQPDFFMLFHRLRQNYPFVNFSGVKKGSQSSIAVNIIYISLEINFCWN